MNAIQNVSRRVFLKELAGASGLVLGVAVLPRDLFAANEAAEKMMGAFHPSVFLAIDTDGGVTIVAHRSEMGTGIRTSLPLIVADELEADWSLVRIEQAVGDERYGSQNTDGSRSIRRFFDVMREAGAAARQMLETTAAGRWDVPVSQCRARNHSVVHEPSGRTLGFGELAAAAADLPVPPRDQLTFKKPSERRYVGKDISIVDGTDIGTGRAEFGIDVRREGMKYASIERCPVLGGKVRAYDDRKALEVSGVEAVVEIQPFEGAPGFQALGGVATVANSTWAAMQGRKELEIDWELGSNAGFDSQNHDAGMLEAVRNPGRVVREHGDVDAAMGQSAKTVTAEYSTPLLAHAPMEPPCSVADVREDSCEAWAATQNPQAARDQIAAALELPKENVTVHVTLLGGGFGRKSKPDYVVEAALLSRQVGSPVQVLWTREDDIRHDYYHASAALRLEAGLGSDGRPTAWLQRSTFPTIGSTFQVGARSASSGELGLGFVDVPYDVPNLRCENGEAGAHVRIGWLRSVCNVFHAFAIGSFTDELAAAAGRDPATYFLDLLGPPRMIDLAAEGVEYSNYGEPVEQHPIDTGRLRHVTELAMEKAGWGRALPRGRGIGIAAHRSFLTYVAVVVEVEVSRDGQVNIPRVDVAVDAGLVVSPDRVRAQMEGSAVFGASLALYGEIGARSGAVTQSNFHDYRMARMIDAPREVHVHLVPSKKPPTGVGEPGVPPFAPALCNAIFAATGKRIRRLPVAQHDLAWT